jgi:hypothetical protein
MFDTVIEFFEENEWHFVRIPNETVLSMGVSGKNGKWNCYAQVKEQQEQFVFYSVCPVNAHDDKLPAVTEFITRANYGLIIGNFELDLRDGEIRYKTSIDVEGDSLSRALLEQLVYANLTIIDRYLPGLMSVIYGNISPEDAIFRIESPDPPIIFNSSKEDFDN